MGESKHTPGPWIIKYSGNGYPYQLDAPNGSRGPGGIRSVTRWGAFSFPSSPEALANARLIAAAPELLEALKEARDYVRQDLKNIGPCEHDVGHCVCGILSMLHRMEEAIARAEGR